MDRPPAETLLLSRGSTCCLQEAVETAAAELRQSVSIEPTEPLSWERLRELARAQRIVSVEPTKRVQRSALAHVSAVRDGLVAHLRTDVHQYEYRFSLAHEIAHTLFYRLELSPPERMVPASVSEERLADRIARALLLPRALFNEVGDVPTVDGTQRAIETLERLAETCEVPLWHLAARCAELGWRGTRAAVRWRVHERGWAVVSQLAKHPERGNFVPLRKRSFRTEGDPNQYVWDFMFVSRWQARSAEPQLGGLVGRWLVFGRGDGRGRECLCLYAKPQAE